MFAASNKFSVRDEFVQMFEENLTKHANYLPEQEGFIAFYLLKSKEEFTVINVLSIWENEQAFQAWTKSESFKKAHAGPELRQGLAEPPKIEKTEVVHMVLNK